MAAVPPFPAPQRALPTAESRDLLALARTLADRELAPRAAAAEAAGELPRDLYRTLGRAGLLALPYPERDGGGGQPHGVHLQVLEELARGWVAVAMGVSVHVLACHALASAGTERQRAAWLPELLAGELLAAYCLSEAHSGSDAAALRARAKRDGDGWCLHGTKSWITHGGRADAYTVFVRDSPADPANPTAGITCFLVPGDVPGLSAAPPERKMGLSASPTAAVQLDGVRLADERRLGPVGGGFALAKQALDAGRLGIAAVAVGLAQAALEDAVGYARERRQFDRPIIEQQGLGFLLADLATAVAAARALYLDAARLLDTGADRARVRASCAMAKTFCTDVAMRVATDAVQVLGGAGYVSDHRVERLFREAKALQIVEGTNQVQRVVVAGVLAHG